MGRNSNMEGGHCIKINNKLIAGDGASFLRIFDVSDLNITVCDAYYSILCITHSLVNIAITN